MYNGWETGEVHTVIGWKKIEGNRPVETVGVDGRIILKYTLKKRGGTWI